MSIRQLQRPGPGMPVTVVGLGRSGRAACRWLMELGCLVRVTERGCNPELEEAAEKLKGAGALVELGTHTRRYVVGSLLVVVSPGVPLTSLPVQWAHRARVPVVSELELGSWYCPGRLVAVTGSNGKSTVVTLVGEILKAAGKEAAVCGNMGLPLCELLGQITPKTIVVLEVSSFQLETTLSFHSEIACVLNVTPNHLDRHGSFAQYRATKGKIFSYQQPHGWGILNRDDPGSFRLKDQVQSRLAFFSRTRKVFGACVEEGWLTLSLPWVSGRVIKREDLPRPGIHHEENALAAILITGLLGLEPKEMGKALQEFPGLPHRQEVVARIRGVTFVNDSKSTTVEAGLRALQAVPGRAILIAGGRDKGSDFRRLKGFQEKMRAAVLIGEDRQKIASCLKGSVPTYSAKDLKEAVEMAFRMAEEGEWVLLSPMCTSFDMFLDFEERGKRFIQAVKEIPQGEMLVLP